MHERKLERALYEYPRMRTSSMTGICFRYAPRDMDRSSGFCKRNYILKLNSFYHTLVTLDCVIRNKSITIRTKPSVFHKQRDIWRTAHLVWKQAGRPHKLAVLFCLRHPTVDKSILKYALLTPCFYSLRKFYWRQWFQGHRCVNATISLDPVHAVTI